MPLLAPVTSAVSPLRGGAIFFAFLPRPRWRSALRRANSSRIKFPVESAYPQLMARTPLGSADMRSAPAEFAADRSVRRAHARGSATPTNHSPFGTPPLNLLVRGKPFGAMRPASARLPRQSASSLMVSEKARLAVSVQVSPSPALNVFTSERPPSL